MFRLQICVGVETGAWRRGAATVEGNFVRRLADLVPAPGGTLPDLVRIPPQSPDLSVLEYGTLADLAHLLIIFAL